MSLDAYDATMGQSRAYGVNSSGTTLTGMAYWTTNQWHAVTYNYSGTYDPATATYSGGSWSYTDINTVVSTAAGSGGTGCSEALAINDAGAITGFATAKSGMGVAWNSQPQAFVYSGGTATILPAPSGMDSTWGWAINANGDVAGQTWLSTDASSYSPYLAVKGPSGYTGINLGKPAGFGSTYGYGMNDYDMVVGNGPNGSGVQNALLWTTGVVPFYGLTTGINDLNALVSSLPAASGWVLNTARGINDAGQIIGSAHHGGTDDAHSFAYMLTLPKALAGDANLDGIVNIDDLSKVLTNYDRTGMTWSDGDFTGDGTVNISDLSNVLTNYDRTASAGAVGFSAVPEPGTLILLLASLAGLAAWRRSR
jgi:hypothetical protein